MKKFVILIFFMFFSIFSIRCNEVESIMIYYGSYSDSDVNMYSQENKFVNAFEDSTSLYLLDRSTAGYSNFRNLIMNNQHVPDNIIKIEEMVNYFDYNFPNNQDGEKLSVYSEIMDNPWNPDSKLLNVGIGAHEVNHENVKNNIVLLVDVNETMESNIDMVIDSYKSIIDELDQDDTLSIVTLENDGEVIIEGANGNSKQEIISKINQIKTTDKVNGLNAFEKAYDIANKYYVDEGNNRVIVASDGRFNDNILDSSVFKELLIKFKLDKNIYFSILGFGNNVNHEVLEVSALALDGNYKYIDTLEEVNNVKDDIFNVIVAKDVRVSVNFNANYITSYRLIGYVNKSYSYSLPFDKKGNEGGELGSGDTSIAVYEITLKYRLPNTEENWTSVKVSYSDVEENQYKELTRNFDETSIKEEPSEEFIFISGVIETCLALTHSLYATDASYDNVISRLENLKIFTQDTKKLEFLNLVRKLKSVAKK